MSAHCVTCHWADPLPTNGGDQGICRFNAPVGTIAGMTPQGPIAATSWPTVNLTRDWCSHYDEQLVKPVESLGRFPRIVN